MTLIISGYWNTIILELKYCKYRLYRVDQKMSRCRFMLKLSQKINLTATLLVWQWLCCTVNGWICHWTAVIVKSGKFVWAHWKDEFDLDINSYNLMKTNLGTNCIQYTLGQCSKYIYIYFINIRTSTTKTGKNGR